ncbi:uncharacterized protein [Drosophila kikkawai]|uniref:Uncharacterized protein n=1 Tax=Drosophila kikkawai TaxID=30033 RepID=A0ABM4GL16_DROKI
MFNLFAFTVLKEKYILLKIVNFIMWLFGGKPENSVLLLSGPRKIVVKGISYMTKYSGYINESLALGNQTMPPITQLMVVENPVRIVPEPNKAMILYDRPAECEFDFMDSGLLFMLATAFIFGFSKMFRSRRKDKSRMQKKENESEDVFLNLQSKDDVFFDCQYNDCQFLDFQTNEDENFLDFQSSEEEVLLNFNGEEDMFLDIQSENDAAEAFLDFKSDDKEAIPDLESHEKSGNLDEAEKLLFLFEKMRLSDEEDFPELPSDKERVPYIKSVEKELPELKPDEDGFPNEKKKFLCCKCKKQGFPDLPSDEERLPDYLADENKRFLYWKSKEEGLLDLPSDEEWHHDYPSDEERFLYSESQEERFPDLPSEDEWFPDLKSDKEERILSLENKENGLADLPSDEKRFPDLPSNKVWFPNLTLDKERFPYTSRRLFPINSPGIICRPILSPRKKKAATIRAQENEMFWSTVSSSAKRNVK